MDGKSLLCRHTIVHFHHSQTEGALDHFLEILLYLLAAVVFNAIVVVAEGPVAVLAAHGHPVDLPALFDLTAFA